VAYISSAESIGLSSTTFRQSVPKSTEFGEITLRIGVLRRSRSSKVTEFSTNRKIICNFRLVIISNLAPILHRFRDIALSKGPKSLCLPTPLGFNPPTKAFPWDDLRKIFTQRSWMANVPNGVKHCRKFKSSE